ncbi:MAG TPA: nucleotidyltransferase domain-containing protein [Thermomicrobiales bacterium]|nr:nucleotidyltransferase domain-containing protein [Thermomicrobiales bacterium]
MTPAPAVPPRFAAAWAALGRLVAHDRYLGAFVFGSVARGEATDQSDLDVQVLVRDDNPCPRINHPIVGGVPLDLTFRSPAQIAALTRQQIATGERIPWLAEALIVFDKTGALRALADEARRARPQPVTPAERDTMRFLLMHEREKVLRALDHDPTMAALAMQTALLSVLTMRYRLAGRWLVGSKRLLADLRRWDPALADLVAAFAVATTVRERFAAWTAIVARVAAPLGGGRPVAGDDCECSVCRAGLATLLAD